jgi:S-methylmethionine-dependent homocysteine/selenocysteine methylase
MSKHRRNIDHAFNLLTITDAGLETWLVFHKGEPLPHFAAFDLLRTPAGMALLREWYRRFADIAAEHGHALLLESPTWRANADWGARLGYDSHALAAANRRAIELMAEIRAEAPIPPQRVLICGNLGPRGDGYVAACRMTAAEAEAYHHEQIATFAQTEADLVSAFTLNYIDEAIGIGRAARREKMPVALSFTVETDGRLPSGESLADAILQTDAATQGHVLHYLINCAHPSHFAHVLTEAGPWRERIRGIRANASCRSHAELEQATELDDGDPIELARQYAELRRLLPALRVIGGCCGTDDRHVRAMARACTDLAA